MFYLNHKADISHLYSSEFTMEGALQQAGGWSQNSSLHQRETVETSLRDSLHILETTKVLLTAEGVRLGSAQVCFRDICACIH